ncbi:MAG: YfaZ family outer membrane protein [Gammaproteobacteria bacterium]
MSSSYRLANGARRVALLLSALSCVAAQADRLDLDLNDDAARLTYSHPFEARKTQIDGSWLHHQDRGDVVAVGFHITGNAASQERPINAGLGGRVMYLDASGFDATGSALAVGGFFDAKIPNYNRFGVGGHLYFAPDVLAFGDSSEVLDLSVHGSYSILRQGEVYVGLRNVRSDFKGGGSLNFDTGLHVGFRLNF